MKLNTQLHLMPRLRMRGSKLQSLTCLHSMHRDVYSVVTGIHVYRFMCIHCVCLYLYICACRDALGTWRISFFYFLLSGS